MTINGKNYNNILLVFALESEAGKEFENYNKVFVGIGKVKATYNLTKAIQKTDPDLIINFGTAGSTIFDRGSVVNCSRFIQRDMDVRALGFQKFETPFSNEPILLEYGLIIEHLPNGICGSGDQFEMEHINPEYNVIDMEAFALAKVAEYEKIDFLCLKYISDGADGNAADDWTQEVKKASIALRKELDDLQ
ncbi:adenosylhomocysteine nucleosidase [Epilithonimonas hungarica]|uniref:5'-methylthioadenosine/S-adenosylhomocysteine nucleosidase family protein n=1 Tax=Epilithonimonas hungarica TaxID=454006 RepID=UPI0027848B0A|nr:nucleosidase [Epilithonimonas hungarica]MDP9957642.1 adenosylhomocysteine nucleosidase [Epilithonimonas hungarica]